MNSINKNTIRDLYINYLNHCKIINNLKKIYNIKTIRRQNFPEIISEHLVLFHLLKNVENKYTWNTAGDLKKIENNKSYVIEVKCSSSNGPLSFGPNQKWHELYICDANKFIDDEIKIYKINCSKDIFTSIKVNNKETFKEQADQKRRPRINLSKILSQLNEDNYSIIYDGSILDLLK